MRQLTLFFLFLLSSVHGVVRRSDVPDEAYIHFGKDQRFAAVGMIRGVVGGATGTLIDPYTVLTVAHLINLCGNVVHFSLFDPSAQKMVTVRGQVQPHEDFLFTHERALQ